MTKHISETSPSLFISGIFLIIMLLGYGLVAVPRDQWQSRDLDTNLKYYKKKKVIRFLNINTIQRFCYFQAVCHNDAKISAEFEFERIVQVLATEI